MAYRARPIRFLQHWAHGGWRMKVYGISAWPEPPPAELVTPALELASATLPAAATADGRHGVGFVGVHDGKNARFMFVSWWGKLYELNHYLFRSPRGATLDLQPVERGLIGCTWDLHIVNFERDAWLSSMMGDSEEPNLEAYLAATFDADT